MQLYFYGRVNDEHDAFSAIILLLVSKIFAVATTGFQHQLAICLVPMTRLVGHRTCDLQVAGSSLGLAPPRNGLGQATYTCLRVV